MAKLLIHIVAATFLLNLLAIVAATAATPGTPPSSPYSLLQLPPQTPPVAAPRVSLLEYPLQSPGALSDASNPRLALADPFPVLRAAAEEPDTGETGGPEVVADPPKSAGERAHEWRWRRAGGTEYTVTAVAALATAYFELENDKATDPDWSSRNEFDEEIRSAVRLESRGARDVTDIAGHALIGLMIAAPVVDAFATLGIRDRNWDALWQTEMVNLEAFTFTSLVSSLTQNLLARERPFVRDCRGGACEDDLENRGFPSGHVAFAFTGAGLVCNHHKYQSLYNDPAADRAVCATGIGLAAADGVLRLVADRHYATDVAAGTVLGLFSGFVLPRLLHYSHPVQPAPEKRKGAEAPLIKSMRILPLVSSNGNGLSCEFRF